MTVLLTPPTAARPAPRPDPTLLRWGTELAGRHRAHPAEANRCGDQHCGSSSYPCRMRRIADRLIAASQADWPQTWTARIDALSCGAASDAVMPPASITALVARRTP